jgi:hypothetical protein
LKYNADNAISPHPNPLPANSGKLQIWQQLSFGWKHGARLSLSQRERTKVRDRSENPAPGRTRLLEGRYQVLCALGDSKIVKRRFVGWQEIQFALDRAFVGACNRDRHHQAQRRDAFPDNKNRGCSGQLDAAGGICSLRNYDFVSDTTEFARNRSRFYGGSERGSQNNSLFRNLLL